MNPADDLARAYAAFAAGRVDDADRLLGTVLRAAPHDPGALTLAGRLAVAGGEPHRAVEILRGVLQRHPRVAAVWLDLAVALRDVGRFDEALKAVRKALKPKDEPMGCVLLGQLLLALDRRAEAAAAFRRALRLAPHNVPALRGLAQAMDLAPAPELLATMESLAGRAERPVQERAELHYTLAQIHKAANDADAFVRHLLEANSLQRSLNDAGTAEYDAVFDGLERAFTAENLARAQRASPVRPVPIFVLGMPRSGTTLVERLLAGHPAVTAAGETDYVQRALGRRWRQRYGRTFPEGFERLTAPELQVLADEFAARLAAVDPAAQYVTDKTPGNFHVIGLLRVLFPQAPIVHVARDPMDTCFSILQHPFGSRSPHTCDMHLLGHVYRRYRRLMARWNELCADAFITVQYERLVASPAAEAERLFAHCGLEWQETYLDFHRRQAAVRTFSSQQVRRPIHQSSVGAWQRFAEHLRPLREALGDL